MDTEPANYRVYSDHRPDVTVEGAGSNGGGLLAGDVKLWDPLGCSVRTARGAYVAFGNTQPHAEDEVHGREERGDVGGKAFDSRYGTGYVAPKHGQYTRARANGVDVRCLAAETLGGFGPELCELLKEAAEHRANRLNKGEYDSTTWAARTWLSHNVQKLSVALHLAVAYEIANSLGLATAVGARA